MGSRSNWPKKLADRFNAVGWDARIARNGHYRIKTHTGHVFSMAVSPSDGNGEKSALRAANKHGFEAREMKFKLLRERERLQRIQDDRASVGLPTVDRVEPDQEKREGTEVSQREKAVETGALGYVDGVAIVERAPAMYQTPIMKQPKRFDEGEELLLADGQVVYRCRKASGDGDDSTENDFCHEVFPTVRGMMNHASWHGRKQSPKQRESLERAWAVRKEMYGSPNDELTVDDDTKTVVETAVETAATVPKPGVVARVLRIVEDFDAVTDEMDQLSDRVDGLRDDLRGVAEDIAAANVDVDELRDKAAKYDELKKNFFN